MSCLGLSISSEWDNRKKNEPAEHVIKNGITWTPSPNNGAKCICTREKNLLHAICTSPRKKKEPLTLWCFYLIIEFGVAVKWHIIYLFRWISWKRGRSAHMMFTSVMFTLSHENRIALSTPPNNRTTTQPHRVPNFSANFHWQVFVMRQKRKKNKTTTENKCIEMYGGFKQQQEKMSTNWSADCD